MWLTNTYAPTRTSQNNWLSMFDNVLDSQATTWRPTFTLDETAHAYTIVADVPGVKKQAMSVDVEGNVLKVKGKREQVRCTGTYHRQHNEHCDGTFERRFKLPDIVDQEAISATIQDGVLSVTVPKKATPEAKKISIAIT